MIVSDSQNIKQLVAEFISILEIEEESDGGRVFRPNVISSCRAMDAARMNKILTELKKLTSDKESHV